MRGRLYRAGEGRLFTWLGGATGLIAAVLIRVLGG